jgi:tetratricopeptide (TPR) repeat protein/predicted Ser/Thr protein kinase
MACVDDTSILAYFRGELAEPEVTAIEHELAHCESCRELMVVVAGEWRHHDGALGDRRGVGSTVGRYVIEAVLGAGAMGVVYEARDPDLARTIALKVMARPSPELGERFRREAQAMARLSHRNVVPVFDVGGAGAEAFVAMELVRGATLREWLRTRTPPLRVLDVFAQAADGLAAAHAAGIVHRDFKPENVLVGGDGTVRVGDFGLAQLGAPAALAAGSPATTSTSTAGAGTPAYLAPEVRDGATAGPRADQYSFAVALHEAIAGARPSDGVAATAIRPRRLARAIARGLARDPAGRFQSMTAFAAELRAIGARRWRGAIAAVALAMLAAGGAAWLAHDRVASPCTTAGADVARVWSPARAAIVLAELGGSPRPYARAAAAHAVDQLDRYASTWQASSVAACRATEVDHVQSAELLDRRTGCLAQRRSELSATIDRLASPAAAVDAVDLADGLPAIAVCDDIATLKAEPVPPRDPATVTALAAIRAQIARAKTHFRAGTFAAGLADATAAVAAARATGHRPVLAEALETLGGLTSSVGRPEAALVLFDEALREAEASQDVYAALAIRLRESEVLGTLGKNDEALRVAQLGLATADGVGVPATAADFDVEIGVIESDLGHNEAALAAYQKGLAIFERVAGADGERTGHVIGLIGMVLDDLGRHAEAMRDLERALAITGKVYGTAHPNYANELSDVGGHAFEAGERDRGLALARQAHAIRLAALDPVHPELAMSWSNLGAMLRVQHQLPEAKADLEHAVAIKRQLMPTSPSLAVSLLNLSQVEDDLRDRTAALPHAQQAATIFAASLGPDHLYTAKARAQAGNVLLELDRPGEAVELLEHGVAHRKGDPDLYANQYNLAEALAALHRDPHRVHELATAALAGAKDNPGAVATIQRFLKTH